MRVLVNGVGNVGTTILNVLLKYRETLGIESIFACKRTFHPWSKPELDMLMERGVELCSTGDDSAYRSVEEVMATVDYVFEASANGVAKANKERYESLPQLLGACAQGSEKGFGVSFMSGVNEELVRGEKFVHVVSCNTHGSAALLRFFAGQRLQALKAADMVVVRRSEDIGNHRRLVTANVVARHLSPQAGTHHSVDVKDMFAAAGIDCAITASDITTPSQLMHSLRFQIETKSPLKVDLEARMARYPMMAKTQKFDSNVVFELGRRYGFNGRIFSHAIVVSSNLLVEESTVRGWAFIPQEGNTILSTVHAFLLQTRHPREREIMTRLVGDLCRRQW